MEYKKIINLWEDRPNQSFKFIIYGNMMMLKYLLKEL